MKGVIFCVGAQRMLVVLAGSQAGIYWVYVMYTSVKIRIPKNSQKKENKKVMLTFYIRKF